MFLGTLLTQCQLAALIEQSLHVHMLKCIQLFETPPWTVARQAPLSMGFSRQEYWSELPFPSPGDLPDSGIESASPALAGGFFTTEPTGKSGRGLFLPPSSK